MTDSPEPPATTDSAEDLAHADIGLVCALNLEIAPLLKRCERVKKYTGGSFTFRGGRYDNIRLAIVESGMGFARARRATQALIEAHSPAWVLSVGFCGGLVPETNIGDIVVANRLKDLHGQEMSLDLDLVANPKAGLHVGTLLTSDEMVRLVEEKRKLAETYRAIAVDLETLAVAQVARETQTRFMVVRAVTDDLSADLPSEILSVIGSTGSMRVGATMSAIFKRPKSVKDMWRLRENAWTAADHLTSFLDGVLLQLYASI